MKTALLIVDVQNDFCPGGALPTPQGDIIVPVINKLMEKFSLIIASRDWHPEDTIHFNHWPVHCVKESHGADFPADLKRENIIQIFEKGTGSKDDGYSAFEATNKNLGGYLKEKEVDELYIVGLTAEYCVKSTVLDRQITVPLNALTSITCSTKAVLSLLSFIVNLTVYGPGVS